MHGGSARPVTKWLNTRERSNLGRKGTLAQLFELFEPFGGLETPFTLHAPLLNARRETFRVAQINSSSCLNINRDGNLINHIDARKTDEKLK
jgi:hypothetical protein